MVRTGATESEVADLVGSNQSQVSRWRAGGSVPRAEWVLPLAELFDVDVDDVEVARVEGAKVRDMVDRSKPTIEDQLKSARSEIRTLRAKLKRAEKGFPPKG